MIECTYCTNIAYNCTSTVQTYPYLQWTQHSSVRLFIIPFFCFSIFLFFHLFFRCWDEPLGRPPNSKKNCGDLQNLRKTRCDCHTDARKVRTYVFTPGWLYLLDSLLSPPFLLFYLLTKWLLNIILTLPLSLQPYSVIDNTILSSLPFSLSLSNLTVWLTTQHPLVPRPLTALQPSTIQLTQVT